MKHIVKGHAPAELETWKSKEHVNRTYTSLPTDVRSKVCKALWIEQGGLCGYTGIAMEKPEEAHIEHLMPQSVCLRVSNGGDLEYRNMIAAFPDPKRQGGWAYGAGKKRDWHQPDLFIDPLRTDCENHFKFNRKGEIEPANANDAAAKETIKRLALNDPDLVSRRKAKMDETVFRANLTTRELERLIAGFDQRNGKGCYRAFCFALKQACEIQLRAAEKARQRKKYASGSGS